MHPLPSFHPERPLTPKDLIQFATLQINAISAAVRAAAANDSRSADETEADEQEGQEGLPRPPAVDEETAARYYEYLRKEEGNEADEVGGEETGDIGRRRSSIHPEAKKSAHN